MSKQTKGAWLDKSLANGFLRDPKTGDLLHSPFLSGIVAIIFFAGALPGIAYGIGARTQTAYRIGDSVTNIVSPRMSYFALIVAFIERYSPKAGIGTLIALMLPYTVTFLVIWTILLMAWLALAIPVGPGAELYLPVRG